MGRKFDQLSSRAQKWIGAVAFILFLGFCLLVGWLVGPPMLRFVSEPEKFRAWVDASGLWGRIAFIGMVFFQVVIALVPGEPLELGAGYAFGTIEGTLLCVAGITMGSLLIFWLVRKFGVRLVEIFFPREKIDRLQFLKDEKKRDLLIFTVFFLPGTPKDLLTYFAGLTEIKFPHYLWMVSIARLPSIITSTWGGSALGDENYLLAILVFAATLGLSLGGWLIYNHISKQKIKKDRK